jgi:hypothetical protein
MYSATYIELSAPLPSIRYASNVNTGQPQLVFIQSMAIISELNEDEYTNQRLKWISTHVEQVERLMGAYMVHCQTFKLSSQLFGFTLMGSFYHKFILCFSFEE